PPEPSSGSSPLELPPPLVYILVRNWSCGLKTSSHPNKGRNSTHGLEVDPIRGPDPDPPAGQWPGARRDENDCPLRRGIPRGRRRVSRLAPEGYSLRDGLPAGSPASRRHPRECSLPVRRQGQGDEGRA